MLSEKDTECKVPSADFPTMYGHFRIYAFKDGKNEHLALVKGNVENKADVPVRMHSQCITGDTFFSRRCDCGLQLENSLLYIGGQEYGIFIYLVQEGRGIGLFNKIKAYGLQDKGADTVGADEKLDFGCDLVNYDVVIEILKYFKVLSIKLITNNSNKINELRGLGIDVKGRIPLEIPQDGQSANT